MSHSQYIGEGERTIAAQNNYTNGILMNSE